MGFEPMIFTVTVWYARPKLHQRTKIIGSKGIEPLFADRKSGFLPLEELPMLDWDLNPILNIILKARLYSIPYASAIRGHVTNNYGGIRTHDTPDYGPVILPLNYVITLALFYTNQVIRNHFWRKSLVVQDI